MTEKRWAEVENRLYPVTISDDPRDLLAAYESGEAVIGLIDRENPAGSWGIAGYVAEGLEAVDDRLLQRVVRRRLKLPWLICTTERLLIREFTKEDPLSAEEVPGDMEGIFTSREKMDAYIDRQYPFYEYGMWALVERATGQVVGKAGITEDGLGYHIYRAYRNQGYAGEACRAVIRYAAEELGMEILRIKTPPSNKASVRLAESLGFMPQRADESAKDCWIFVRG